MITIKKSHITLFFIVLLGASFRFYNLSWDENAHLHPDERFITMVVTSLKLPESISAYFNPLQSSFSPYNVGYPFFVYGSLPLYLTKIIAISTGMDNYNDITILGRLLSTLFDIGVIVLLYLIGKDISKHFFSRKIASFNDHLFGLLCGFMYASTAFAVQQSHFFTVDSFLTFFSILSFFILVKESSDFTSKKTPQYIFTPVVFGFAIACKITALLFLPFFFLYIFFDQLTHLQELKITLKKTAYFFFVLITKYILFLAISYIIFRTIQPFYFSSSNYFHLELNPNTLAGFQQLMDMDKQGTYFPPAVQWQNKQSIIWPLQQMIFYGIGPIITIMGFTGIIGILISSSKKLYELILQRRYLLVRDFFDRYAMLLLLCISSLGFFLYQATRFTMNMRYFYPIYPFIIILSVFFILFFIRHMWTKKTLIVTSITIHLIWLFGFLSIYHNTTTRIEASKWIYSNISPNSTIAIEHWDDPLPLNLSYSQNNIYNFQTIPIFDLEDSQKWNTTLNALLASDYYILSSNRGWGSIPTFSERYPKTTVFYKKLFNEELGIQKVAEIKSRPRIGQLEFNDDLAEESFTVYDHPVVIIYKITNKVQLEKQIEFIMNSK